MLKKTIKILNNIEEYTLGLTLLALAMFACFQVFTRYALNISFTWFEELSRFACVFLTFLGASLGIKYSTHFSMTAVVDKLPYRLKHSISALIYIICALFFAVVAWYGYKHCLKHFRYGNLSPAMRLPMYIPYLPIPLFSGVMVLRCLLRSAHDLKHAIEGAPDEPIRGRQA